MLLPVVLMLAKAIADVVDENGNGPVKRALDFVGNPLIALLLAVLLAMFTLGVASGFDKERLSETVEPALPPIAGILLIVAAGGGFKQVLVDSGISKVIASWVEGSHALAAAAGLVRGGADPAGHRARPPWPR